ncbi:hypothetical protein [Streptosporangium sp. NPDC001681]|uniref:hypothetical protein n=1 Tax=Streptosporangium sp. NPDC001681 TaxID=3154395 RepID=UPI0033255B4D
MGAADDDELYDAARTAERILGREVNISRISSASWTDDTDNPFVMSLRSRPLHPLIQKRITPPASSEAGGDLRREGVGVWSPDAHRLLA